MDKNTKVALISLGALAGIAAISLWALYEEDKNNTISDFLAEAKDFAGDHKDAMQNRLGDFSDDLRDKSEGLIEHAKDHDWLDRKQAKRLVKLLNAVL